VREAYVFRWSFYRDTVTLRRVPGAVSPTPTHGETLATSEHDSLG
jgi:hypothetical protein